MAAKESGFEGLTWEDLTLWAGTTILSRGKSYKREVSDLSRTNDRGIIAWVHGTRKYATMVRMDSTGTLSAVCSCPYAGNPCKHSVAVVLAYLDALKSKQDVPQVAQNDGRMKLVKVPSGQKTEDEPWDENHDDHDDVEDIHEFDEGASEKRAAPASRSGSSRKRKRNRGDIVRQRIESMDKGQLVEFVLNLVQEYPAIGRKIEEEEELKAGRVSKIVDSIRAEIELVASETSWYEHWSGEGNVPDYSGVRERLQRLLDSGHADAVVQLGEDLWSLGNEQLGSSHDEGQCGDQISECMAIVIEALSCSSLSTRDRILWVIETCLSDEYGLLNRPDTYLAKWDDPAAWNDVADSLLGRLENMPQTPKKGDYVTGFRRREIMDWAIEAFERCGRTKDIIPLLEREAPRTHCYGTLVEHLLCEKRRVEAKAVAIEGFRKTMHDAPVTARNLEAILLQMAEEDKDLPLVAAYRALEFFESPSLEKYRTLKKAANAAGHWPAVREAALRFLETGSRPDLQDISADGNRRSKKNVVWPLPSPEIPAHSVKSPRHYFPDTTALVEIAIYEKDSETVLRWHEVAKKSRFFGGALDAQVADAVKKSHPDVSLKIWRDLAEAQIRLKKPNAYGVAATYLRKMRDVYQDTHREPEWTALIKSIRVAHKPKRSLMEILDGLEAKRILDT
jgi:uncharacterized Zn finger protein